MCLQVGRIAATSDHHKGQSQQQESPHSSVPNNDPHHGVAGADFDFKKTLATATPVHAMVRHLVSRLTLRQDICVEQICQRKPVIFRVVKVIS